MIQQLILDFFLLLLIVISRSQYSPPIVDDSVKCLSCLDQVDSLYTTWTNATSVQEILDEIDKECKKKFIKDPKKLLLCEEIAGYGTINAFKSFNFLFY